MSMSAVYILDLKGKSLISRNFRGDIETSVIEKFLPLVLEQEEESVTSPIVVSGPVTFVYIKYNNLYIAATTKINANAALIFSFLHKLVQVLIEYFKALEEESIRDNFVLIYELLDEIMDFGYPQTTETKFYKSSSRNKVTN